MSEITERLKRGIAERYLIERELGQGGMATVYLAHDLKHDRKVALKVLRPELAAVIGAERFLQEIRVTANLQHSHILPLYDSGVIDGLLFYVMPYVEGETLRDLLEREKQLGVDEAVTLTRALAAALDHAHKHGVIHRDIKPENILMREGDPLIADFGIALALSHAGGQRMTETGLSIGTPQYMSPEQAMGDRELDPRSDVYSLGAVLYELLTGDPPYTGSTAQAIVAKVITEKAAPVRLLRDTVPEHVSAAIQKALAKLPADRFHSAAEFADALVTPGMVSLPATEGRSSGAAPPRTSLIRRAGWPVAAVLAAAVAWLALRPAPPEPVTRYGLELPPGQAPLPFGLALASPDGSRIAYHGPGSGEGGQGQQLWIKARDQYKAVPLPGTDGAGAFTWSPDGQWIAFWLRGTIEKIPVVGGAAITLTDSVSAANVGLAWLDNGTIVYVQSSGTVLRQVAAMGGPSHAVFTADRQLANPDPLPGGRGVLFAACVAGVTCDLRVLDLRSDSARTLVPGADEGVYTPTGDVVYVRPDGATFAMPFDVGSLRVRGSAVPVLDSVLVMGNTYPRFGISRSGTLVMRRGADLSLLGRYRMIWVDRKGLETPLDTSWTPRFPVFGANAGWAISPDGKELAIGLNTGAGDDIWLKPLPRGPLSRVTYDSASEYRPRWMPGGRRIMFESNRPGPGAGGIYTHAANGTGQDSLILRAAGGVYEAEWSPDKKWLVYRTGGTVNQTGGRDIVGIRPGVDTVPQPVVVTPYDEEAIAISPSGRLLAYESNETGRTEIFLRTFPNTNEGKWQVSNGGGQAPLWSRDGKELFYVDAKRDMVAVPIGNGPDPRAGPGHVLFHMHDDWYLQPQEFYTPFDVAPDGRFLMAESVTPPASVNTPLIVVDNWFRELKGRMKGAGK